MKRLFQRPRFGLTSPSLWAFAIGILCCYVGATGTAQQLMLVAGTVYLAIGIFIWQEQPWAIKAGLVIFGINFLSRVVLLLIDFQWKQVGYGCLFGFLAYDCWKGFMEMRNHVDDEAMKEANENDQEGTEKPMIAFVLLQKQPKYLENMILAKMVESAWGGNYSSGDEDQADGFVVGESPLFVIKAPFGMYLVHNHANPYWNNTNEVVEDIGELRLRKAVADHEAWLSVDLISSENDGKDPSEYYPRIAKLIIELADEDTLAIFRPESNAINVWSEELVERLSRPNAHEEFASPTNVPVISISDDDPAMMAAVETAKRRWPDFVEAFKQKRSKESEFAVKVKLTIEDNTEFIWVDVIGLEPNYIHGKLANDPVDLGDLKLGSRVEVPISDVCDWCYFENEIPIGLFSLEAIKQSQEKPDPT